MKNAEACKDLSTITKTSLGPNGMHKLVINHLNRLFVTSDTGTIVQELEVVHPAAKMIVMAALRQGNDYGDNTNFVVTFAGELLNQAVDLLRGGVHPVDIVAGYKKALEFTLKTLPELCNDTKIQNVRNVDELSKAIRSVIASKQYGFEEQLSRFISQGCIDVMPSEPHKPSVNVDNVRVCKLLGKSVTDSLVMKGMVLTRDTNGIIKHAAKAKVAVFNTAIESAGPETKGTVLLKSAEELMNYNKSEEKMMEDIVESIAASGVKVVVCGGSISEMGQHFLDKYNILSIKLPSKFDMRRICSTVHATALVRLGAPTPEEMGYVDSVDVVEIGGRKVTIFKQDKEDSKISTLVIRGSTNNILDDVERTVDDGVSAVKSLCKDQRLLPGAGATEIELAYRIQNLGESCPGLEQYAIKKYATCLETIPRILAENCGEDPTHILAALYAQHANGNINYGVDVDNGTVYDVLKCNHPVYDSYATKENAFRLALDAVITILKVDQLIMSKPAGGPKPRSQQNNL